MYLTSSQSETDKIRFFYELINRLIEKKDNTHIELIKKILITTHLFACGKLTFYDIDTEIYDVVSGLVKSEINKDYFRNNVQLDNITTEDFVTLRNTLSSLSESYL